MATGFFNWKQSLSVNIKEIDDQHKKLIELINRLYDAFMKKDHEDVIGEILNELKDYTNYHFSAEEKYFVIYGYSGMHDHIAGHLEFVKKINEFEKDLKSNSSALTYKMMNFLREWLQKHIMVEDMKYVKTFQKAGLK